MRHLAKARDGGAAHVLYKNVRRTASPPNVGTNRERRGKGVATPHFLVHSPKDNVGVVVVEGLRAGTDMLGVITATDKTLTLKASNDIPIGHKVALKPLKRGDTVIKYGEDIGRMTADAAAGEHVHVQNLKTNRW
ncbi:MAG: UxaA family hydrolase [Hyphomicrobiaceae bacterium]|nr:UxaA family hydrolase [Hyphomicrobiaceae bacterium]